MFGKNGASGRDLSADERVDRILQQAAQSERDEDSLLERILSRAEQDLERE